MRHFCFEKAAFFKKLFGLHLDFDILLKIFLTVVGLGLSFKKSRLDLDYKFDSALISGCNHPRLLSEV